MCLYAVSAEGDVARLLPMNVFRQKTEKSGENEADVEWRPTQKGAAHHHRLAAGRDPRHQAPYAGEALFAVLIICTQIGFIAQFPM